MIRLTLFKKNKFLISTLILSIMISLLLSLSDDDKRNKKIYIDSYIVNPSGYPELGKCMINERYEPANWLDHKLDGKLIQEPINIVIIDYVSRSSGEAVKRLLEACKRSGFQIYGGHSAEYMGYIDGNFYNQLPEGFGKAFSDSKFNSNNDHGRIFGPCLYNNVYYFTGAFSREDFIKGSHRYDSFIKAREVFAKAMDKRSGYQIKDKVNLDNKLINDPVFTSGDHDGQAAVLVIK